MKLSASTPQDNKDSEIERLWQERDDYRQLLEMIVNPGGHRFGMESVRAMAQTELSKYPKGGSLK